MALNNAVASVEMEGYKISDNEKELCMKVLDGKLTKDEFIKIMFEKVQNN
ncbi:unknown [Firmicutes bacterium CAG:41]|nr:unknown [Firmicutes bacterium CAG:41]